MILIRTHLTTPEPVIYYEAKRNESIVFSIDKDPQKIQGEMEGITTEEISSVKEWIKLNYDALMSHWKESGLSCPLRPREGCSHGSTRCGSRNSFQPHRTASAKSSESGLRASSCDPEPFPVSHTKTR